MYLYFSLAIIVVFIITMYLSFTFLEALYKFRAFIDYSKSVGLIGGGYYQALSIIDRLALRYLSHQCELSYTYVRGQGWTVTEWIY